MPDSNVRDPEVFADEGLDRAAGYFAGPYGAALRAAAPVFFPGVPAAALAGLSHGARHTDNTTSGSATQRFHEVGLRQTPAGPREGPAPNPDSSAPDNAWGRHARTAAVRALLGRDAVMAPDAWRQALADQAVVGLAAEAEGFQQAVALLDPRIRPPRLPDGRYDPSSPFAVALSFAAFSAGESGAARVFNRWADALAGVPVARRWDALVELAAADFAAGRNIGTGASHANPAYTLLRTLQKLEAGRALAARADRGALAWFGPAHRRAVLAAITTAARGQRPAAVPPPPGGLGAALFGLALGAGLYLLADDLDLLPPALVVARRNPTPRVACGCGCGGACARARALDPEEYRDHARHPA
jgi:hypothetical protein